MQNTSDQITDYLVGLITTDKPAYSPNELIKAKIPAFVVERIRLNLEDKIRMELGKEECIWFDKNTRLVQEAWADYLNSAIGASHIPKAQLYNIIHEVVTEIVDVIIEPRKHYANYVFRDADELDLADIELRCSRLSVYKHFATAIPLYMKKRKLTTLTKERCSALIHKLDAKLVEDYSSDDWMQKLEQMFDLFGGQVAPNLVALFFEDKGLSEMAQKFKARKKPITKENFIPIINGEAEPEEPAKDPSLLDSFFGAASGHTSNVESNTLAGQFLEGGLSSDEMTQLLDDIANEGVVEVDNGEKVASLNELFFMGKDEPDEVETSEEIAEKIRIEGKKNPDEVKEFRENLMSILDQAKDSYEGITRDEEQAREDESPENTSTDTHMEKEALPEASDEGDEHEDMDILEGDDHPMWARFLRQDQMEVLMGGKRSQERTTNQEEFQEESHQPDSEEEEIVFEDDSYEPNEILEDDPDPTQELMELLSDRQSEFIDVIFNGSEQDFLKAIQTISTFTTWKETSSYIKKEIFTKNDVDLFSGATVDFTDRLHRHFNELI